MDGSYRTLSNQSLESNILFGDKKTVRLTIFSKEIM